MDYGRFIVDGDRLESVMTGHMSAYVIYHSFYIKLVLVRVWLRLVALLEPTDHTTLVLRVEKRVVAEFLVA